MNKFCAWFAVGVFSAFSSSAAQLYEYSLTGSGLYYMSSQVSVFSSSKGDSRDFWSFCNDKYGCFGYHSGKVDFNYMQAGGVRLDEPYSVWGIGENLRMNGWAPVDVRASASSAHPASQDPGRLQYVMTPNLDVLNRLSDGESIGIEFREGVGQYIFPGQVRTHLYSLTGQLNPALVPNGFSASLETAIHVELFASWGDPAVSFDWYRSDLYSEKIAGSYARELTFALDFSDYPIDLAEYASYQINISNRIVFTKKSSEVPEPSTMALAVVAAGAALVRRKRRSDLFSPKPVSTKT